MYKGRYLRENSAELLDISIKLFVFFLAIYLLTFSVYSYYFVDVSQARIDVARSIIERFDLTVPSGTGIVGDDGRDYSWFGIGSVLISLPFYLIAKMAGISPINIVSLMNLLFGAATAVLIFYFVTILGYSRRASICTAIIYGLGTMAFYYAKDPSDHILENFFIILSVYYMFRYIENRQAGCIFKSGGALGVACLTRPTSFIVILPLVLMLGIRHAKQQASFKVLISHLARDVKYFILGILPFLGIFLWYNYYRFGSIFETGHSLIAARTGLVFFSGTPLVRGLAGFLVSPGKGFFYYSPITLLFFIALKPFMRRHLELALCFVSLILIYVMFYAKNIYWHGNGWGPRYLFSITPFLVIPIAALLDHVNHKKEKTKVIVIYALFVLSFFVQIAAVSVNPSKYYIDLQINNNIKFTVAKGHGVQPIVCPPDEIFLIGIDRQY